MDLQSSRKPFRHFPHWTAALSLVVALLTWYLVSRFSGLPAFILPSPEQVAVRFWKALTDGSLLINAVATLTEILLGLITGTIAAVVLGASRALGETIAVLMVVGNVPQIPTSIFDSAYPLPALIANNYGEMMSIPLYDAALLGAALVLLVVILIFNILSTVVLQRMLRRKWA